MQIILDADLSRSSKNNNSVTDVESQRLFVYASFEGFVTFQYWQNVDSL